MKIVTVVGARPQFIKAAAVSREIKKHVEIEEVIIHTGQHYDLNMSEVFFEEMGIPKPGYKLQAGGKTHGAMTGYLMEEIEKILINEQPDILLVYGDTNSTLAAALSARKLNIKICHVESGLRNFDFTIPEDVNRVLTDRVADLLICSTQTALDNLEGEGFHNFPCKIFKTGDLMADVFFYFSKKINSSKTYEKPFVLCTVHRASSTKSHTLESIVESINTIADDINVMFPIHPRTRAKIEELDLDINQNITLIDPVGYLEMLDLLHQCDYVITDSGGLQREAYLAKKKSLLLMEYTPWEELISNNYSVTTSEKVNDILCNYEKMKELECDFSKVLYGDGNTAVQIVNILKGSNGDVGKL